MRLIRYFLVTIVAFVIFLLPCISSNGFSQSLDDLNQKWEQMKRNIEGRWSANQEKIETQWDEAERQQKERWEKLREEVELKWQSFEESTKKVWVAYEKDREAKSRIDFENGIVEVTAIVPVEEKDAVGKAKEKLAQRIKEVFSKRNDAGVNVLEDQIRDKKGEVVKAENLDRFIKEEAIKNARIEGSPYTSRDGRRRIKVSTRITMVPNHIYVRAEKYLNIVAENSRRFGIKPQLILAIIHTESYFNPMAVSPCGAIGLMQLIPRFGAREAYQFLYGKDRVILPKYLYDPKNNIELGTAYLFMLKNGHFGGIKEVLKNRYLTICGYNWGPTKVKENIVQRYNVFEMRADALFKLLQKCTPEETRDYLRKVTERMRLYDNLCSNLGL